MPQVIQRITYVVDVLRNPAFPVFGFPLAQDQYFAMPPFVTDHKVTVTVVCLGTLRLTEAQLDFLAQDEIEKAVLS